MTFDRTTFTVTSSRWAARADGRAALVFFAAETKEIAPQGFAFEIDLKAIEIIRAQLAQAEAFLRSQVGSA